MFNKLFSKKKSHERTDINKRFNLIGRVGQGTQVVAVELDRILALHAGNRFGNVVLQVLREVEFHAREIALQLREDFFREFVLREALAPLGRRLERREELGIEESSAVRSVIRAALLGGRGDDLRELHQRAADLDHHARPARLGHRVERARLRRAVRLEPRAKVQDRAAKIRDEDMLPYLQHMTHVDFPLFLRMLKGAGEHTSEDYLPEIDVPVLVVAGEKDTFTPAWLSEHMARRMPKAKLVVLPSGSHAAPIEQPDVVLGHVREFLSGLGL